MLADFEANAFLDPNFKVRCPDTLRPSNLSEKIRLLMNAHTLS
jgi:hypothetical protein